MEKSSSASDQKSGFIVFLFSSCGSFLISLIDLVLKVDVMLLICCFFIPFCCEDALDVGNGSEFKVHVFSSSSEVRNHDPLLCYLIIIYIYICFLNLSGASGMFVLMRWGKAAC